MSNSTFDSYVLKVKSGLHGGVELVLPPGDYTIGREATCDIVLSDSSIADQHARLVISDTEINVVAMDGRLFDRGREVSDIAYDWTYELLAFELADIEIELVPERADTQSVAEGRIRVRGNEGLDPSSQWSDASIETEEAHAFNRSDMTEATATTRRSGLTLGRFLLALLAALLIPALVLLYLGNQLTDYTLSASNTDPAEEELRTYVDKYSIQSPLVTSLDNGSWSVQGSVLDNKQAEDFQIAVADAGFDVVSNLQVVDAQSENRTVRSSNAGLDGILGRFSDRIGSDCLADQQGIATPAEDHGYGVNESLRDGTIRLDPVVDVAAQVSMGASMDPEPTCFEMQGELVGDGVLVLSGFVNDQTQLLELINEIDVGVGGISTFNTDDVVIGNVARDALERYLDDADLERSTQVYRQGNQLRVSGALNGGGLQRWSEVNARFFERFPNHVIVRREMQAGDSMPVKLQAVWAGENPYVILGDGQIYLEGSTLNNGWVLRTITPGEIVLEFNQQTYTMAL